MYKTKMYHQQFTIFAKFREILQNTTCNMIDCSLPTVRAEIFVVVLFSRISRVKPSRKFPLQFMIIYSNDNISKIAKLTTCELPHLAKTAKITVRENNAVYSIWYNYFYKMILCSMISKVLHQAFAPTRTNDTTFSMQSVKVQFAA